MNNQGYSVICTNVNITKCKIKLNFPAIMPTLVFTRSGQQVAWFIRLTSNIKAARYSGYRNLQIEGK